MNACEISANNLKGTDIVTNPSWPKPIQRSLTIEIRSAGFLLCLLTMAASVRGGNLTKNPFEEIPPAAVGGWKSVSGEISFAAMAGSHLRMEVLGDAGRFEITVSDPTGLDAATLIGKRVLASGVPYEGGISTLTLAQLKFEGSGKTREDLIISAANVRALQPKESAESRPVKVEGIVTMATNRSMVVQDESGGVFVLTENSPPERQPRPGERWMITGKTASGDFSPIIIAEDYHYLHPGALPPPCRPSWEEILNGRLDAEQVEIEGILTSVAADRVEILTRDGTAVIQGREPYPLPAEFHQPVARTLLGARVKLRGVFASSWKPNLGRLQPGVFALGNAELSVVTLAPADASEVPLVTIPDLWKFTSQSTALNRVRLRGRLMARRGETWLVSDGASSLRLVNPTGADARPGDEIEVVGFGRTGAISPVIVHPEIRVTGHSGMPHPSQPDLAELPDFSLDGSVIQVTGQVVGDTIVEGGRRVELESGARRFLAIGPPGIPQPGLLERDSKVRVKGVYFALAPDPLAVGAGDFEIRLTDVSSLEVISQPPWWTTRRLLILIAVLLGGLALVAGWAALLQRVVKRRTSQLAVEIAGKERAESDKALEQERARVARDLHDELGAGLTEIGLLGSLVANPAIAASAKSGYIGTLGDVSRSLVCSLDGIVWAINPEYDSVDDLAGYLWLHAQRMLAPAGIACDPMKPLVIPAGQLGSRSRHALLLAFKEALNNVIKHAHAKRVKLELRVIRDQLVITVADDGTGISLDGMSQPGSQGLPGMRERMREHGGDCEITALTDGTQVALTLPLRTP